MKKTAKQMLSLLLALLMLCSLCVNVFAADEETVLFIECKCAFSGKKGDFKTDLEAIKGIKEGLFKTVRREKEFKKKKVKYIATVPEDLNKLMENA